MTMFRHDVLTTAETAAERYADARAKRGEATTEAEKAAYVDQYLEARAEIAERTGQPQ